MKNSIKYLYFIAFFAIIACRVTAQGADTLIFQSRSVRSIGCGFPAVNYDLLSPLNHSGYSIGTVSTRFREQPGHIRRFQTYFGLGLLYNYANDSYLTTFSFNGALSFHWHITDPARALRLLLGGETDSGISAYMKDDNTNNPMAYFFNLSVSPTILVKYRFNINGSKFELGQQVSVPAGSLISSSDYSSSMPHGFTEQDANFFDATRIVSLGSFKKFSTSTTLDITSSFQQRKNMPDVRISWIFSGMNYNHNDISIKSVEHMIVFGVIYNLFR